MSGVRIYGPLSDQQLAEVTAYSSGLGLSKNAPLLALLIVRAVNGGLDLASVAIRESSAGNKVVLQLDSPISDGFLKLVERENCSRAALASSLLVHELKERWLEAAVQK